MRRIAAAFAVLLAGVTGAAAQQVSSASGGELRVLDKLTGSVINLTLQTGETGELGFLDVTLVQCRYPTNNPAGDAYVELVVFYQDAAEPAFAGWMLASAPALNAMDHPRYDVWALRCITS